MDLKEKQIIYVDNKPHIKCDVIMLPTISTNNPIIYLYPDGKLYLLPPKTGVAKMYHLYITSDEEIKEVDWVVSNDKYHFLGQVLGISALNDTIALKGHSERYRLEWFIKIIATTDTSLGLPRLSQQFIKKWIEEYNKGNVITKVLIEVHYADHNLALFKDELTLKLDSQNQITIRKQKDSWSREELPLDAIITLRNSLNTPIYKRKFGENSVIMESIKELDKWIEENL